MMMIVNNLIKKFESCYFSYMLDLENICNTGHGNKKKTNVIASGKNVIYSSRVNANFD